MSSNLLAFISVFKKSSLIIDNENDTTKKQFNNIVVITLFKGAG